MADLRARVAALHPEAWPPDRAAAAKALLVWHQPDAAVVYLGDGLTHGGDFTQFAAALGEAGKVTELRSEAAPARLLLPPENEADRLVARVAQAPQPLASKSVVLAQSGDGRTLARATLDLPAGASRASAAIVLPPELRNRLSRLVLEGPPTAASVVLLDERWRRRPVGILAGDLATADTPFAGPLYYLHRALAPFTEVREADLATLLQRELSVLILADRPLPAGAERDALTKWVEQGGLLIRFAGPRTAEQPLGETDPLMPVKLLSGDRQLGGALSWAEPAGVAQFSASSPFAGLTVPDEVKVNRQVLAEPSADLTSHTWATLADGTPLVTQIDRGRGTRGAVPRHRQCRLVQPAAVRPVRRYAAAAGRPVGGRCADLRQHRAGACGNSGRLWPAVAATPGGDGSARQRDRPYRRFAAPPARAVRTGERPARAQSRHQSADARGGATGNRRSDRELTPTPCRSGRSGRRCWQPRWCCSRSTC